MFDFGRWTPVFIAVVTIVVVAFAALASFFAPVGTTISEVSAIHARRLPITPLALGIVVGHIYLSGKPTFQAMFELASDESFAVFLLGCLLGGALWPHRS